MKLQISILLFILFATTAFSQIKYFPTVFLDMDQDGIEDVIFKYNVTTSGINQGIYWFTIKANDETETEIEFAANGSYAKYLDFNDTIDKNLNWQAKSLYIYSEYENKPKQWGTGNNYFIGIRIKKNDVYYYGWIRFNSRYWGVIERDFAIQSEPGKAIKAGEGIKSITPVYEGVKSNENNIAIITDFFPPFHKTYVAEYRLYIVKCSDTGELNTDKLLSVPNSNYQVVAPGEKRYSVELNKDLLTIDNDTLNLSEFYQICVLAYSNNNDTFPHSYILTDTVTVNVLTVSVDKPVVFDTGDYENSKDIQVKFAKSNKESFLKDYKLMILPADSAATFNLKKAIAVPEQFTHTVTPSNDSIYTVENTVLTDIYGNEIQQNKRYNAFILSAHDGTHSNISSLSPPSNLFVLNNPDYFIVGQKDGEEIIYHKFDSGIHTLDFDNDGEVDITTEVIDYIEAPGFTKINIAVFPGENTEIICSDNNLAKNMEENSALFSGHKWSSDKLTLYRYSGGNCSDAIGEFGKIYGFIGFRKIVKNDTIYGWLKTGCCYNSILEFAFKRNTSPNSSHSIEDFTIYPNPNSDRILNIQIKEFNEGDDYSIDILNSTGIQIKSYVVSKKTFQISIATLRRGFYYVRMRSPEKQTTQKLIVL